MTYRRINVYSKSTSQYKRERARRKQVLELSDKGLTQHEISLQLGVSSKTVYRDLKRQRGYREAMHWGNQSRNMMRMTEALDRYPLLERFEVIDTLLSISDRPSLFIKALGQVMRGENLQIKETD